MGSDVSGGYSPSILNAIQNASIAAKALSFKKELRHPHNHDNSHFANRPFSIATLLYLATVGGAAVCNIEEHVGSFGPGKSFDALLVNVGGGVNPALWGMNVLVTSRHGIADASVNGDIGLKEKQKVVNGWLESFLHGGDDRNIEKVYVQGRFVGGRKFPSRA